MILSERNISIAARTLISDDRCEKVETERRRMVWLASIAFLGAMGMLAGITALIISLLTLCGILLENRRTSLAVTALIVSCLGTLLLAAHGMDRLAALRRKIEREGHEIISKR